MIKQGDKLDKVPLVIEVITKPDQIDFTNSEAVSDLASDLASKAIGKKSRINIKAVGIIGGYFVITGIVVNVIWIVKLILKLF